MKEATTFAAAVLSRENVRGRYRISGIELELLVTVITAALSVLQQCYADKDEERTKKVAYWWLHRRPLLSFRTRRIQNTIAEEWNRVDNLRHIRTTMSGTIAEQVDYELQSMGYNQFAQIWDEVKRAKTGAV